MFDVVQRMKSPNSFTGSQYVGIHLFPRLTTLRLSVVILYSYSTVVHFLESRDFGLLFSLGRENAREAAGTAADGGVPWAALHLRCA